MAFVGVVIVATLLILSVAVAGVQVAATRSKRAMGEDDDEQPYVVAGRPTW